MISDYHNDRSSTTVHSFVTSYFTHLVEPPSSTKWWCSGALLPKGIARNVVVLCKLGDCDGPLIQVVGHTVADRSISITIASLFLQPCIGTKSFIYSTDQMTESSLQCLTNKKTLRCHRPRPLLMQTLVITIRYWLISWHQHWTRQQVR